MPDRRRRSPARFLAPLALVAVAFAVVVVVGSAGTGSDDDGGDKASKTSTTDRSARTETTRRRLPANYTVKTGDTLGAIAEQTGVSVEQLQELNPELDPQALVSGQRIKLRE